MKKTVEYSYSDYINTKKDWIKSEDGNWSKTLRENIVKIISECPNLSSGQIVELLPGRRYSGDGMTKAARVCLSALVAEGLVTKEKSPCGYNSRYEYFSYRMNKSGR